MSETITRPTEKNPPINGASFQQEPPFDQMPDHTDLPYEDGTFVQNFQEHPQSLILTSSIFPVLQQLHPDGQFAIGQDSGIYWKLTDPYLDGATAPDWFYVPGVPSLLDGEIRRSYVMWKEIVRPLIVIEFVSATDGGERDTTPQQGKFWIYEQAIVVPFYAIFDVKNGLVDVYRMVDERYQLMAPNERKHFPIPPLGLELRIWRGVYNNQPLPWLRWWDDKGNLLPTAEERAEQEAQRAEQEAQRAEQEVQRAARLAAKLLELGIDPEDV